MIEMKTGSHLLSTPSRAPDRRSQRGQFTGLQFWDGHGTDLRISPNDPDCHFSFAICIQTRGRGMLHSNGDSHPLHAGEALLITPFAQIHWSAADAQAECVIASGGPVFSLRFRPHRRHAIRLGEDDSIGLLLTDCIRRMKDFVPGADGMIVQKMGEVLADLIEVAIDEAADTASDQNFLSNLVRAEDQLDSPAFDVNALATELGMTLRSLQKRFYQFDTTPREWMAQRRLERTRRKLDDPLLASRSIKQIAFDCGFRDFSHFSRSFKSAFGLSPRAYRP
ncbi:helix-turn-helix domain-containing protein [Bradyrhizobium sp. U87765 SZCCT0131]|uniref:AraC family transcriptional regulator n=1 Tax=unclassified Bradyrhizobium TaxID=2631580 RepID=UPI001BA9250A|nr:MULTISPECIES: AraC family transcriptional regulator [unclassified Bradyrhizobium]MBR1217730.1 helix-turn-helix domain-containing protein [Bradyrhizobium sp. U87765 SZCCT0131]MBR1261324.1 helix-turn-helix domain-containing protein [Bradyrhizobium sp. U87765 SZCCT0134]MBR1303228.1 helix-turn-helix domain-containing protein [Bradyrhizobium sp. U87765 SZCCT0110]MBR1318834.1 helix-turn-helix domain-containing protein [Bradyrhizobium sp. U87765 SZCCT0109]MBR1347159.1 helix-turn-helix domain-conta